MLLAWESIGYYTTRMKVFGGWIVRVQEEVYTATGRDQDGSLCLPSYTTATTFVPDPEHKWGKEEALTELITKGNSS